jgi:hypothetical protein
MIYQDFYSADGHFRGWRCIGCGEIVDEVILENRRWAKVVRQSSVKRENVVREDIEAGD